jgi:hypothetical protein
MFTIVGLLLFVITAGASLMSWRLSRSLATSEVLRSKAEKAEMGAAAMSERTALARCRLQLR